MRKRPPKTSNSKPEIDLRKLRGKVIRIFRNGLGKLAAVIEVHGVIAGVTVLTHKGKIERLHAENVKPGRDGDEDHFNTLFQRNETRQRIKQIGM